MAISNVAIELARILLEFEIEQRKINAGKMQPNTYNESHPTKSGNPTHHTGGQSETSNESS